MIIIITSVITEKHYIITCYISNNLTKRKEIDMKTDFYTKFILTLIAIGLFLNVAISLIPNVYAFGSGSEVQVTNYETDVRSGETLNVFCKNCNK